MSAGPAGLATAPAAGERTATRTPLVVLGAGGLLAGELLRLALEHPHLRVAGAVTRHGGEALRELHPHLRTDGTATAAADVGAVLEQALGDRGRAALVLALPHGEAAGAWRDLRAQLGDDAARLVVVDLSADHRLRDPAEYARWYGAEHPDPGELARFVYGLPELLADAPAQLAGATRVAAPGCFATALQLAAVPAARAGLLDDGAAWTFSAVTGSTGSGNKPKPGTHHPHRQGNLWAYGLGGHRHEAELGQALSAAGARPPVVFVPHSGPFARGIHLTAVLPLAGAVGVERAHAAYADAYAGRPFVDVLPVGGTPDLRSVVGSNCAALGVAVRGASLVVTLTLDNVVKGGAGQALQALNLALGRPETEGLPRSGMGV